MNVLLLGSGGRESAMAWKIARSSKLDNLYLVPGNPGTASFAHNLNIKLSDFEAIKQSVKDYQIDLVVVGPEQPLVCGIVDFLQSQTDIKIPLIVGPSKEGARLEGSKDFAKQFMMRHDIPTAAYQTFTKQTLNDAKAFLKTLRAPYVLKADGLAAGKGVIIEPDYYVACSVLEEMFNGKFGNASESVVIEEFLSGIELSVFVLTDGRGGYVILPEAKDYKRIGEHDTGLNTGGMGSISPVPFADKVFMDKVETRIICPTVRGLMHDNIEYKGFIFFGLINVDNEPFVIEYNVRMGDPETESVMPRIKSDFLELLFDCGRGALQGKTCEFEDQTAATVMIVSGGYPEDYKKGIEITGVDKVENAFTFHAGTKINSENKLVTDGGRVIAVTAMGSDIPSALQVAVRGVEKIKFNGAYHRRDIGLDLMK